MYYLYILYEIVKPDSLSDPRILIPVIVMIIGILLPFLIWFLRNFCRIVLKKQWEFLNRSLKWFFLLGLIIFIITLIFIVLVLTGVM